MGQFSIPCGHIDWPCCGCNDVAFTGEDAIERMQEDEDYYGEPEIHDDPFYGDDVAADADVLRNAGMGTDEDYGYFGP